MLTTNNQTKKSIRRKLRRHKKGATELSKQADQQIEKLLIRRFGRLVSVRRFVFFWVALFVLLIVCTTIQFRSLTSYYQVLRPVAGGLYNEGLIGTFTNANPLYATSAADTTVSRLVFSGLFKYNKDNRLVGDLASSYIQDKIQTRYIVNLKQNIVWHDGRPFTADDVVFTYKTIQNITAQSPLYSNWKNIKITKKNPYTVVFDLPDPLSAFPYSLTGGIVPKHLLDDIHTEQLRSAAFNSKPVGTGPFKFKSIESNNQIGSKRQQIISLSANKLYWDGRPKLDGFSVITFSDEEHLVKAFMKKQLNAIGGLEELPLELEGDTSIQTYSTPLTSQVMAFFNNSQSNLKSVDLRKAMVAGIDKKGLPTLLDQPIRLINGPLLPGQLGYDASIKQPSFNLSNANRWLNEAGWKRNSKGMRVDKSGKQLALTISSQDTHEYSKVAQFLQKQWIALGIKTTVNYYNGADLQSLIIANHDYDILLYGINIGVDPDVFAFWDSSQASLGSQGHLNVSEYKSKDADQALEAGRTRPKPSLRAIKYRAFLRSWAQDSPALALYQPSYLYIARQPVFNYERKASNSSNSRLYDVHKWMIRQQHQNILRK